MLQKFMEAGFARLNLIARSKIPRPRRDMVVSEAASTAGARLRPTRNLKSSGWTLGSQLSSPVKQYLPHLMVGVTISLVMIGAYAVVGFSASTNPKASWATNPLTIHFVSTAGRGGVLDSFACSPSASGVVLLAKASTAKVSLTATPTSFSSCNSFPHAVTLTAQCLVSPTLCRETYSGLVQIRQPANYRNIPANLAVR